MPLPINDISNPEVIKFMIENFDKTKMLRMKWNQTHGALVQEAAVLKRKEKGYTEVDVLKAAMADNMVATTADHLNSARNRRLVPIRDAVFIPGVKHLRKDHTIPKVGLGDDQQDPRLGRPDTDLSTEPVMRPIDPKERMILYKNVPFFGRQVYLKRRGRIPPEERYYMRESEGWEYGWRLKDSYFCRQPPKYGRVSRISKKFSRSGAQPDPVYYSEPSKPGISKCND